MGAQQSSRSDGTNVVNSNVAPSGCKYESLKYALKLHHSTDRIECKRRLHVVNISDL